MLKRTLPHELGLQKGNIALRPVLHSDLEWLLQMETHPAIIRRFRLSGSTPSPEKYRALVERAILTQFLVVNTTRNIRIGLVYAYNADLSSGRASVAFVSDPEYDQDGPRDFYRGVFLFLNHLFTALSLRKIYGDAAEFNFGQFANRDDRSIDLTELFKVEAILPKHSYFEGTWWDSYLIGLNQTDWMSHFDVMVDQMYGDMLVSETLASNRNAEREVTADRKRSILIESESSVCPVALRPVRKEDERWIASLYLHPANRLYTRAPKATVQGTLGIHELESLIWEGVLSQFIIEDQLNQLPIGLMTAHKAEWLRQTLAVHALVEPPLISDSIVVEGIRHFVNYLLKCWPLRQIFFEYLEGAPIMPSLEKALTDNEECLLEKCGLLRDWVIDENGSARSLGIYVVPCDSRAGLVGCTIAEY